MSQARDSSIVIASLATSLEALAEARIGARRRALAEAESHEARAMLRAIVTGEHHPCASRAYAFVPLEHGGGIGY